MISLRSVISWRTPVSAAWRSKWWFRSIANTRMEKVNQYAFYEFGIWLGRLREIGEGRSYSDLLIGILNANIAIRSFLNEASGVPLTLSRRSLERLHAELHRHMEVWPPDGVEWGSPVKGESRGNIDALLDTFEKIFAEEAQELGVFCVSRKGTHDSMALMATADENLPEDTRARLSPDTIRDIRDAGKCLALDCHTASGYHILRAVERVIIEYVDKVTSKVTLKKKPRDWGAYITVLKNHGGDAKAIGNLQHIKDHYRNPIIHPEDTLGADDAFSLFNTSISVIIQLDAAIQAAP